jgi:hypothetical protein
VVGTGVSFKNFPFFSFFVFSFFHFIEMTPAQIEATPTIFSVDTTVVDFWVPLKQDKRYEINDVMLKIRNVETKKEVYPYNNINQYIKIYIGGIIYDYHRLIAEMFVFNFDPITKTCVDHIDRNKYNNMIENLHWVSIGANNLNRSFNKTYVSIFVKSLPNNARQITHYKCHELKYQYFISNKFVYSK